MSLESSQIILSMILTCGKLEKVPYEYENDRSLIFTDPGHSFGINNVMDYFAGLSSGDRINLLKGFVLCERRFEWRNGSVPTVPYLIDFIVKNDNYSKQSIEDLYNWMFLNRGENPYTPTGFVKHSKCSCNSFKEMMQINSVTHFNMNPNNQLISRQRKRKEEIKQLKISIRQLEKDIRLEKLTEKIERFSLDTKRDQIDQIKNHNLNFPITLLPRDSLSLFISDVEFTDQYELEKFTNQLPRRSNKDFTNRLKEGLRKRGYSI